MARSDGRFFFCATTRAKGRTDSHRVSTLTDPETGELGVHPRDYFTTSSARAARIAAEALNAGASFDEIDANPTERALAEMNPPIGAISVFHVAYVGATKRELFERSSYEGDALAPEAVTEAREFATLLAANAPAGKVVVGVTDLNGTVTFTQVAADGSEKPYN